MKKIIILVVFLIITFGVSYMFYEKKQIENQENTVINEYNEIVTLNKNREDNKDKIDDLLNRRLTKDEYLIVETAMKKYLTDLYNTIDGLNTLATTSIKNYLSIDNIKKDGPLFEKSKEEINSQKEKINKNIDLLIELLSNEEKIMSYLDEKDLEEKYINIYKRLIVIDEETETIKNKYNSSLNKLNIYLEALEFLVTNKDKWSLKENQSSIWFEENELYKQYNSITSKLTSKEKSND